MELIKEAGLSDMVDYIAIDYNICKRIIANDPNALVGYLNGDKVPSAVLADGIKCIDYSSINLAVSHAWLREAKEIGVLVNVWTVNSTNDMLKWIEKGVDFITTDHPDVLQTMVELYCN
jgi:glycerophosphoryl diester phosphodiesterase